jgi:hypothetical protein
MSYSLRPTTSVTLIFLTALKNSLIRSSSRHCNERHCRKESTDKTQLGAHYTETRHSRSPKTPDGKLPSFEGKRGSEVCSSCGAEGHYPELCTQENDCHSFSKAFGRSRSSCEKIMAVGKVDGKSLGDLEFKSSVPLKLRNWNLGPATEDERASNEWTDRVTLALPPVIWSMKSLKPSSVAIVTPVNAGKGSQGALDESTPLHNRERSDTRRRETTGKRSPSRNREDLRRRLIDPGRDRSWPIMGGCWSCGALDTPGSFYDILQHRATERGEDPVRKIREVSLNQK